MQLINISLETGVFPDKLKMAKIIPIFKVDDPPLFKNYRPISLRTNFSKFYERVMHSRLLALAERFEILCYNQFGFRKNHSTILALIHLINKISSSIDHKEITAGVFLNLSKYFDTINHDILYLNFERYGIRGVALEWIKSYFKNRTQFVQYNNVFSVEKEIRCGVPQGSILGPLFFILYINDLPGVLHLTESLLFADDTSIFYSHNDPDELARVINEELEYIDLWMKVNKLSVNINKTNYILFNSKAKTKKYIKIYPLYLIKPS